MNQATRKTAKRPAPHRASHHGSHRGSTLLGLFVGLALGLPAAGIAAVKQVVDAALGAERGALVAESDALERLMAAGQHRAPMRRFLAAGGQTRAGELTGVTALIDVMLGIERDP